MGARELAGAIWVATAVAGACDDSGGNHDSTHPFGSGGTHPALDAGAMSNGGSAGTTAGSGGTAGAPAAGGAGGPDATPSGRSRADTFALASAVLGSCIQDDGVNRNNGYLWYAASISRLWGRFAMEADCLASHGGGCDAIDACIGWSWTPGGATCAPGCEGDVFRACGLYDLELDCSRLGLHCDEVALCSTEPAETCDPDTFTASCTAEGIPEFCDDDAVFPGVDCASLGLTCETGQCAGSGAACDGEADDYKGTVVYDGQHCEGDILVACVAGREHGLDCTSLDPSFTCQSRDNFHFCGLATECLPALDQRTYGTTERCEGSTLVFCNAGREERIDCTSLGFTGCDVDSQYGCFPGFFQ